MTTGKLWDAEFLNARERDARDEAVSQLAEADWKRGLAEAERIRANSGRRYRFCKHAARRRARHCGRYTPTCAKPAADAPVYSPLAHHLYEEMQVERRDAAMAEKKKDRQEASGPRRRRPMRHFGQAGARDLQAEGAALCHTA